MIFSHVFVHVYYVLVEHFLLRCTEFVAVYADVMSPLGLRDDVMLLLEVSLHVALLVALEAAQLTVVLVESKMFGLPVNVQFFFGRPRSTCRSRT